MVERIGQESEFVVAALLYERATQLSPDIKRYVGSIRTGATQMSQLIEDLLSFSLIGRQDLARRVVNLELLCRNVTTELESETRSRAVELKMAPLPHAFADPALLHIVFVNLLSNALKYSRAREPALIEIGRGEDDEEGRIVIFVRDNGVGFEMKDAGKLFGVFQRLHHAHEFEGTGVGLATVRRIIERHGGRIWAESKPDLGAAFFFALPKK